MIFLPPAIEDSGGPVHPLGALMEFSKQRQRASVAVDRLGAIRQEQLNLAPILDHGDELAKRFEDYEPKPGDERPVEEYRLERATIARARTEREVVDAVTAARDKGVSWQRIGGILGTSAQAAQQRYGAVVEAS